MTDEHKLIRATERAARAQALIDDETLTEGWGTATREILDRWMATKPEQTELREALWHSVQGLAAAKRMLKTAVTNGRFAKGELDRLAKQRAK